MPEYTVVTVSDEEPAHTHWSLLMPILIIGGFVFALVWRLNTDGVLRFHDD